MIVDYENPLKKMMEEFVPHGKVGQLLMGSSVEMLEKIFFSLPTPVFKWRQLQTEAWKHRFSHKGDQAADDVKITRLFESFYIPSVWCILSVILLSFPFLFFRSCLLSPLTPLPVPIGCFDQPSDGVSQEEFVRRPVEERPATLSHLCSLHHAQSRAVRHCKRVGCSGSCRVWIMMDIVGNLFDEVGFPCLCF